MSKSSQQRALEAKAAKLQRRADIEKQYGLKPGSLQPKPISYLGRYAFIGQRNHKKFVNSLKFLIEKAQQDAK